VKTATGKRRAGNFHLIWPLLTLFVGILTLSSCYVTVREPIHEVDGSYRSKDVYLPEAPPALRSEVVVGLAPSQNHTWVGGYWTRHQNNWHWMGGRWAARPHPDAVWVDGRWDRHPRGYVRIGGHWR
jgi:hypothetical protein